MQNCEGVSVGDGASTSRKDWIFIYKKYSVCYNKKRGDLMFNFKIEVSESEKTIRDRINENMKEDRKKAEKSILSWSPDYERGLHFLNNDEKICGFYQHMDQFNQIFKSVAIKDDPGRAYFKGKFINENDNLVFKVFIYTN